MKQAQPFGQKMDQARAGFRRAVEAGEKALEALQKAQANFEAAQGGDTGSNGPGQVCAGSPVASNASSTSQRERVQNLGSPDGNYRNMWNPDAGQPPEHLMHAIQESRAILQTSPVILSQEGAQLCLPSKMPNSGTWTNTKPSRWRTSQRSTLQAGRCRRRPEHRKATAERTPLTPPQQKKTRTMEPEAVEQGGAPPSQVQRLSARAVQKPRDTELLALSQRACALIPALASS